MRRELAEKRGRTIETETPAPAPIKQAPKVDDDLVPDVLGERSEDDIEVDSIIASIDVLDAYRRWICKEVDERTTGSKEGIKVSCPIPGHRDKNPSAWLNSEKKTWFCGGCQEGGDLYDLAAIKFGYPRPDYKEGKTFHELRQEMAESYGYRFKKVAGQEIIWREEEVSPPAESTRDEDDSVAAVPNDKGTGVGSEVAQKASTEDRAEVVTLHAKDVADEPDDIEYPTLDWQAIVPENTFLRAYLEATRNDDSPEEYHFFHGLLALGHAVGRDVTLDDDIPVYANMLVCLLGGTGFGKSRSQGWLQQVLNEVVPFKNNGLDTEGCLQVPMPASGEAFIKSFRHVAEDPSLPKGIPEVLTPINGLVNYGEFSTLLALAGRKGAMLSQTVHDFADTKNKVDYNSLTQGIIIAERPFCSVMTTTQPKAARTLLKKTDADSGFLNRWVFVAGPKKKRKGLGGSRSAIRVDLGDAIEELKKVKAWGAAKRVIETANSGGDVFSEWLEEKVHPLMDTDETALLGRLDLIMKKMVLLFCINEKKRALDLDVVKRAQVMLPYVLEGFGILGGEMGTTLMQEVTDEIMRHIKRLQEQTGRGVSARELSQRMKHRKYSPEIIKKALEIMVSLDYIDIDKTKSGPGRPTIRYKAVAS